MKVDVVIPNYNGLKLINENLPKVIESVKKYKAKIIIVDDCSEKDEFEGLSDFVNRLNTKKIILLRNEKNLGFSSTVNRGVSDSDADLVVLLNTDVIPEKEFLDAALKDFLSDLNLFGVGFMDKSIEEGKFVLRGRGLASWHKGMITHRRGEVDKSDTFWISGGSSLIRRDLFEKLSGFDDLYNPFYWEDIDLSYRARKAGFSIKFESKSVVEHRHKEGSIRRHYGDFKIKTIAYRNQFIFIWKNITDINLILSHVLWLPYHSLRALVRFDTPFFLGLFLAFKRLPAIIGRRKRQRKLYQKKDFDLI